MKLNRLIVHVVYMAALVAGCQSAATDGAWSRATEDMLVQRQLEKIFKSQCLSAKAPQVMSIGKIKNDTFLVGNDNIQFMRSQIASALADSGLVMISTAFGGDGKEVSLPQDGKVIAPTLTLYGKLTQRDSREKDGKPLHEFILELSIVEISTSRRIWYGKSAVGFSGYGG